MDFGMTTIETLKAVMQQLSWECDYYEWGSDEYEFLQELIATIEDEVRK